MEFPLGQPQGSTIQGPSCIYGMQETYISFPLGFKNKQSYIKIHNCHTHTILRHLTLWCLAAKDISDEEGSLLLPLIYLLRHCHLWSTEFCMHEVLSAGL